MAAPSAVPPASDLLRIDVVAHGPAVQVHAAGEIDSSTAPVLEHRLDDVIAGTPDRLVIDLRGVTFLDSAGLRVLATAHKSARRRDVDLRVLVSARAVMRPLQITGLAQLLGVEEVAPAAEDAGVA
ncbi:STAS domain-containing protein [Blastococcus sp. TML/M2B]|uniref:STAS domain-containing protein n=1 Tax=unclassified Blastococcus TaxID=2619396 RepID=UPI00190A3D72|nr:MULTISPECIES: STAS domain-containing protein [unclassified Blastococcus]MBN1093375.1 STAS domain-containing protein [Blastococcus sp. TML/M2B]MBN1096506.1 STAS domain-containing protein [Blastococcus sp. TML/C7B]